MTSLPYQTFHQFHDLYTVGLTFSRVMHVPVWSSGAFATGVASQQGTLTLPDTWFRPPFWDLLMLQLLRPNSSNLPCLYSTFHLEYPLVLSRFYLLSHLLLHYLSQTPSYSLDMVTRWHRCAPVILVGVRLSGAQLGVRSVFPIQVYANLVIASPL